MKDQGLKYPIKVLGEQNVGQYRVNVETVAELLGHLKENNIRSFFRLENGDPVLYCGVMFEHDAKLRQVFATGVNIISDESLDEQNADDVKIKLKVISLQPDNKKEKSRSRWATMAASGARCTATTKRKRKQRRGANRNSND